MGLCSASLGSVLLSDISHHLGGFPQDNCLFSAGTKQRDEGYLGNGTWEMATSDKFNSSQTAST